MCVLYIAAYGFCSRCGRYRTDAGLFVFVGGPAVYADSKDGSRSTGRG